MYQRQLSFEEAVRRALTLNYCNFEGRSSRSEYWWFCLFNSVLGMIISVICAILFGKESTAGSVVSILVSLSLLLPSLGLSIRRMHDIGRSGWYILIALIPFVGWIIYIIWAAQPSQPEANQYGDVPNAEE